MGDSSYDQDMSPEIFVELMKLFFNRGWMVGSGGGMAAATSSGYLLYSPSSVQKELLSPKDLFVFNQEEMKLISRPTNPKIRESACVPVFNLVFNNDEHASCVIHTHSKYANLLTQLVGNRDVFEISNQEMIKGIIDRRTQKPLENIQTLRVPIIDNAAHEFMLVPQAKEVLKHYPEASAILVRNHGLFVWGPTWQKTKIMLECYEYLFELACDMLRSNLPLVSSIVVN